MSRSWSWRPRRPRPRRHRQAPAELLVRSHNVEVGRPPADVAAGVLALVEDRPHVVVLQEARQYVKALRAGVDGYRVFAAAGWAEAANSVTLIRDDLYVPRAWALRLREGWRGPKIGRRHPGRTGLVVDLGRRRDGWRILNAHGVRVQWGVEAAREQAAAWRRYLTRDTPRARSLVGDLNEPITDRRPLSPAGIAVDVGAELVDAGGGVDWAILVGATGVGWRGGSHGSDHPARFFRFTRRPRVDHGQAARTAEIPT